MVVQDRRAAAMNAISITSGSCTTILSLKNTTLSLQQPNSESIVRRLQSVLNFSLYKANQQEIPCRNVIDASFDTKTRLVKIIYLYKSKQKNPFLLSVTEGQVAVTELRETSEWIEMLMNNSYAGK
jgi:hypothetical protein